MSNTAWPLTPKSFEAYRKAFRAQGVRHRFVDRWRYELGWVVTPDVVENYLMPEVAAPLEAYMGTQMGVVQ